MLCLVIWSTYTLYMGTQLQSIHRKMFQLWQQGGWQISSERQNDQKLWAKPSQASPKKKKFEQWQAMRQPAWTCIVLIYYLKFSLQFGVQICVNVTSFGSRWYLKEQKPNKSRQLSSMIDSTTSSLINEPSQIGMRPCLIAIICQPNDFSSIDLTAYDIR